MLIGQYLLDMRILRPVLCSRQRTPETDQADPNDRLGAEFWSLNRRRPNRDGAPIMATLAATRETVSPRIPTQEFAERVSKIQTKMRSQQIDLLVAYSNALDPGHVRYFSDVVGINEAAAIVIPSRGEAIVCAGPASQAWAAHKSRLADVRVFPEVGEVAAPEYVVGEKHSFADLFRNLAGTVSVEKIGMVGRLIFPQVIYARLKDCFPEAEIVDAEPLVFELRVSKSSDEIACIRKAAGIVSDSFREVVERIRPGWTELDIMGEIAASIFKGGAEDTATSWLPMIPSGREHSNLCMNRNTLRKVQEGEIICLQAGATYEGYNAALCSPLVLGDIPLEIKRAVNTANEAMEAILGSLRPGASSKQVNAAGKSILSRAGYGGYSPYAMVHNIGCLECESPWMPDDADFWIVEGMTVCVDIFLFRTPWGSFRIEDTLAITANGCERLTTFNQEFVPRHFA
jgi:Xaa-Pro aminopeptidase